MEHSIVSRRSLLKLGALTCLTAAVLPYVHADQVRAADNACDPGPCPIPYFEKLRPATPKEALTALEQGNQRWYDFDPQHPDQCEAYLKNCSAVPQKPFAAILSCADSRVPPELLFDLGVADLFVARVAGNSAVPITEDSLVYGTEHLGALVLFVLGHSDCGAVTAAVKSFNPYFPQPTYAFEPPIYPAVRAARKIVEEEGKDPRDPSVVTPVAIDQHVILTTQALNSREPFKDLVKDDKLLVKGGRYDLRKLTVTILI